MRTLLCWDDNLDADVDYYIVNKDTAYYLCFNLRNKQWEWLNMHALSEEALLNDLGVVFKLDVGDGVYLHLLNTNIRKSHTFIVSV